MVETIIRDDIKILKIYGEINLETYNKFRDEVLKNIMEIQKNIIMDMEEVTYTNSMGLSTIIKAYVELKKEEGELKLCCLQHPIRRLFQITKLDDVIDIYETLDEAIDSLQ